MWSSAVWFLEILRIDTWQVLFLILNIRFAETSLQSGTGLTGETNETFLGNPDKLYQFFSQTKIDGFQAFFLRGFQIENQNDLLIYTLAGIYLAIIKLIEFPFLMQILFFFLHFLEFCWVTISYLKLPKIGKPMDRLLKQSSCYKLLFLQVSQKLNKSNLITLLNPKMTWKGKLIR